MKLHYTPLWKHYHDMDINWIHLALVCQYYILYLYVLK